MSTSQVTGIISTSWVTWIIDIYHHAQLKKCFYVFSVSLSLYCCDQRRKRKRKIIWKSQDLPVHLTPASLCLPPEKKISKPAFSRECIISGGRAQKTGLEQNNFAPILESGLCSLLRMTCTSNGIQSALRCQPGVPTQPLHSSPLVSSPHPEIAD